MHVLVHELRTHIQTCIGEDSDGSDELPDPVLDQAIESFQILDQTGPLDLIPLQINSPEETIVNGTFFCVDSPFVVVSNNEPQSQMVTAHFSSSTSTAPQYDDLQIATDVQDNTNGSTHTSTPNSSPHEESLQTDVNTIPVTDTNIDVPETRDITEIIAKAIEYCLRHDIQNPVEMLRYLQSVIVKIRRLEIEDITQSDEGETNFVMVDRNNILETTFDEINSIDCAALRTTLEVQFYNETAVDHGGPRKECFQLVLSEIKTKYFDKGLTDHLAKDYTTVGKIMGLSVLQNGRIPKFMESDIIEQLFTDGKAGCECIENLKKGLNSLGLVKVGQVLPMFVHLFRPSETTLTLKAVIQMLKPSFMEEGSNSRRFENSLYSAYLKYLRAVASGRRGSVSLGHVLQFATGTPEEPVLGFTLHPSIDFVEATSKSGFVPTANTCISNLKLPRPSLDIELPPDEELFSLYDNAFLNSFYGLY